MRVRSCLRCKQFVQVLPNDATNQVILNKFDTDHKGHGIITTNYSEMRDIQSDVSFLYMPVHS